MSHHFCLQLNCSLLERDLNMGGELIQVSVGHEEGGGGQVIRI